MLKTNTQKERLSKEWSSIAKEKIEVEVIKDSIYAFCSELASLRLLKKYRLSSNADCGYSENLKTFYFRLG